jgi:hypothetical protein
MPPKLVARRQPPVDLAESARKEAAKRAKIAKKQARTSSKKGRRALAKAQAAAAEYAPESLGIKPPKRSKKKWLVGLLAVGGAAVAAARSLRSQK